MNVLSNMYFEMGKYAFLCGKPFCEDESFMWQQGWRAGQKQSAKEAGA